MSENRILGLHISPFISHDDLKVIQKHNALYEPSQPKYVHRGKLPTGVLFTAFDHVNYFADTVVTWRDDEDCTLLGFWPRDLRAGFRPADRSYKMTDEDMFLAAKPIEEHIYSAIGEKVVDITASIIDLK